jgi:hypothetical protein
LHETLVPAGQIRKVLSVAPIALKKVVNQALPMFYGAQQHDAQEFLSFFLDRLSEDLNRVDKAELEKEKKLSASKPAEATPAEAQEDGAGTGAAGTSAIKLDVVEEIEAVPASTMTANEQIYHSYFQPPMTA